mmetsp:Transcript_20569/g.52204  ORF Transcript_20569/g.52204 Transcript_20569/m.52204 type:complete len:386 (-) Transcript_20569:1836-2993(-)
MRQQRSGSSIPTESNHTQELSLPAQRSAHATPSAVGRTGHPSSARSDAGGLGALATAHNAANHSAEGPASPPLPSQVTNSRPRQSAGRQAATACASARPPASPGAPSSCSENAPLAASARSAAAAAGASRQPSTATPGARASSASSAPPATVASSSGGGAGCPAWPIGRSAVQPPAASGTSGSPAISFAASANAADAPASSLLPMLASPPAPLALPAANMSLTHARSSASRSARPSAATATGPALRAVSLATFALTSRSTPPADAAATTSRSRTAVGARAQGRPSCPNARRSALRSEETTSSVPRSSRALLLASSVRVNLSSRLFDGVGRKTISSTHQTSLALSAHGRLLPMSPPPPLPPPPLPSYSPPPLITSTRMTGRWSSNL